MVYRSRYAKKKNYGSRYRSKTNPYTQKSYNRAGVGYYAPKWNNKEAARQIAVYKNPFSKATNQPKIPDGKCSLSTGQRFQSMNDYACPVDGDGVLNFILFGGVASGCYIYAPTAQASQTEFYLENPGDHGKLKLTEQNGFVGTFVQANTDVITMWRTVSQGLKLTLTNNADENDGFFESVRLAATRSNEHWKLATKTLSGTAGYTDKFRGPLVGETCSLIPYTDGTNPDYVFGVDLTNLVDHPTYQTGKLRDIHKFAFNNRSESNDHDFKRMRLLHSALYNDMPFGGPIDYTAEGARIIEEYLDDTCDIVIIRVHGRSGTVEGGATKLLAHFVSNQEICYENGSTLSRFHTSSYKK